MGDYSSVSLNNYINSNPSKNITLHHKEDGIECYSSEDNTITIAASGENNYSILEMNNENYREIDINKFTKDIYDFSEKCYMWDIYSNDNFSTVNYYYDGNKNGIYEVEAHRNFDDTIETMRRDDENGEITSYKRTNGQSTLEYNLDENGEKSVIFGGEQMGENPNKWLRKYTLDLENQIKEVYEELSVPTMGTENIKNGFWIKNDTNYYNEVSLNIEELAQEGIESFNNWIARENLIFKARDKKEDIFGKLKDLFSN